MLILTMLINSYTKNFIIISFISIIITRLVPHPPNFTSAIAIGFYLPALFGLKFLLVSLTAYILSDLVIGTHELILFTWGSLILVGIVSKYFKNIYLRMLGVTIACLIFYLVSNFGVWLLSDLYASDPSGLILCYIMGLPFLQNSLIGTLLISTLIELLISFRFTKSLITKINSIS